MHPLVLRQLKRALDMKEAQFTSAPVEWQRFIELVDRAYRDNEADRELMQRSMEISSRELVDRNQELLQKNFRLEKAEDAMRQSYDQLEQRVGERTEELSEAKIFADQARLQLQLLLDSTGEGIYAINTGGYCTLINNAAAQMLGYNIDDLVGQQMHDLIHNRKTDGSPFSSEDCPIHRSITDGRGCRVEADAFIRRDGSAIPVAYTAYPMRDGRHIVGSVVAFSDITQRRRAEDELRRAKETADHASQAKSDFLAHMSHEIRTPLNGVVGMLDILSHLGLSSDQLRCVELATNSANALLTVINDILDFSKIEAGKIDLESVDFDLHKAIQDLIDVMTPIAAGKSVALASFLKPDVPRSVRGDPTRFRQVLTNLLSNAIKFTPRGTVTMRASLLQRTTEQCFVQIEVEDTGPGILPDRAERLFKSFSQLDASTTRNHGGTGLGLVISKRLVEMMGGEIGVNSEPGKGATFWFTLRLLVAKELSARGPSAATPSQPASLDGLRVLLAEDNKMNQYVAGEILKRAKCVCTIANNGREAVETYRSGEFDIILMDCQMPEMDGLEATAIIRRIEANRDGAARTPILALTADAIAGDREKCLAAGMDGYVTKPVNRQELFAAMSAAVGATRALVGA